MSDTFFEKSSFIRHYLWKYRRFVVVGFAALFLVDVLEAVPPIFLKRAVDVAVDRGPLKLLGETALAYFGVSLVQGLCRYAWRMYLIRASVFAGRDLRGEYTHHLFSLSASFFDRTTIGSLMSLSTSDVESVRTAIGSGVLVMLDSFFYFITVPVAMYFLSPKLTLLAFIPLPVIPWLVLRNEREVHVRYEQVQEHFGKLSAMVTEGLTGIRVVKAFAKEDIQVRRFREAGEEFLKLNLRLARVQSAFGPSLDFTMSLGLVLLLWIGGRALIGHDIDGLTLGTFVAFQRYIQKMVWPMAALGMAINMYQRAVSSSDRLKETMAERTDVPEASEPRLPTDGAAAVAPAGRFRTPGAVEFRALSFRFPGTTRDVLCDVNLRIEPGERVAFVGAVGAGKSALLSLLPRLYPVTPGMLFVDGIDVNLWPIQELRQQVGYVSQEVFLFSESVTENVAYGLHEWSVREGEPGSIEEATQLAAVHEDVLGLTQSYRTRLGERGVNLSGGQKQRLTIARALAKRPPILVLDDALSSVDVQTEERILGALRARPGRNTEIIAAHRISTIRDADRIVVLDAGAVRQVGTHAELVADRRGLYRRYYEQQQLREELEQYENSLEVAGASEEAPAP